MMKTIIMGKEKELTDRELIMIYKQNKAPNILAYMFISNFGMFEIISNKWSMLDETDKASFCLEEINKALMNFDLEKNIKFSTYIFTCFNNRLRSETELINCQKRKSLLFSTECDDNTAQTELAFEDVNLILEEYKLNENEKQQCILTSAGYTLKEMTKMLNKTTRQLTYSNLKIREKILKTL